ncbi:Tn3 family transposase [Azospirillum soli]|uniref:Tn3 family transposase n=1 Tax=Azospirillum soli TaxID=1304799 RepID=UPI001AE4733F|nr:Tn3 family transposase [Azospirillum soli]MBP2315410.1 hypothetical protein [Azospirillum soli]
MPLSNLRIGETCDIENALLAAILADGTNLGLTHMAEASQGVTRGLNFSDKSDEAHSAIWPDEAGARVARTLPMPTFH